MRSSSLFFGVFSGLSTIALGACGGGGSTSEASPDAGTSVSEPPVSTPGPDVPDAPGDGGAKDGSAPTPGCRATKECKASEMCDVPKGVCVPAMRIATYNILGAHFTDAGSPICNDLTGAACAELRAKNAMAVIRGKSGFGAFDVVGVQEMERDQFVQIGQGLSGVDKAYAAEPIKYDRHPLALQPNYLTDDIDDYARTIYWRTDRFTRVADGTVIYPTNDGTNIGVSRNSYAPWVRLKSKQTGRDFVVLNHHAAVTTRNAYRSPASALFREQTARILTAWATERQTKDHLPVVILGDFNSTFVLRSVPPNDDDVAYGGDRKRLPYCVMTASGVLRNAEDAVLGKTGPCPTAAGGAVDHVYVTGDLHVDALVRVKKMPLATSPPTDFVTHASDHAPAYADLGLPTLP